MNQPLAPDNATLGYQCPKCGMRSPTGKLTCVRCGARLYVACRQCGKGNPRSAARCSNCGHRLHRSLWSRLRKGDTRLRPHEIVLLLVLLALFAYWFWTKVTAPPSPQSLIPNLPPE